MNSFDEIKDMFSIEKVSSLFYEEFQKAFESLKDEVVKYPFEKEIAVMVARNRDGEIKSYPLVEMEFDDKTNICDTVIVPAREEEDVMRRAQEIAMKCIETLDADGIFGVEMFLTKDKEIIVNEIAVR